jgi:hypothetical protein
MDCQDKILVCVCYFGIGKLKKENSVGHFNNGSKVIEKKILVSK